MHWRLFQLFYPIHFSSHLQSELFNTLLLLIRLSPLIHTVPLSFCRPEINGKMEARDCGNGCDFRFCLSIDEVVNHSKQESLHLLHKSFEAAETYIERFQFIREFYNVNLAISSETLAENECESHVKMNSYLTCLK